ncbi:MAG: hypothetical protein AAB416_00600 [Patescibacteria group bacterium]
MYAVANIEKFTQDYPDLFIGTGQEVVARAREFAHAESGLFTGSAVSGIFQNPMFTMLFVQTVQTNPTHIDLFKDACRTAGLPT